MSLPFELTTLPGGALDIIRFLAEQDTYAAFDAEIIEATGLSERAFGKALRRLVTRDYIEMQYDGTYALTEIGIEAAEAIAVHDEEALHEAIDADMIDLDAGDAEDGIDLDAVVELDDVDEFEPEVFDDADDGWLDEEADIAAPEPEPEVFENADADWLDEEAGAASEPAPEPVPLFDAAAFDAAGDVPAAGEPGAAVAVARRARVIYPRVLPVGQPSFLFVKVEESAQPDAPDASAVVLLQLEGEIVIVPGQGDVIVPARGPAEPVRFEVTPPAPGTYTLALRVEQVTPDDVLFLGEFPLILHAADAVPDRAFAMTTVDFTLTVEA